MWNLLNKRRKLTNRSRVIDGEKKLMVARGEGLGGLGETGGGIKKYKLIVAKHSCDVKFSTGI